MKNVLIISSSPRKGGNSDVLCDEFAKGVAASGNKVEKITLTGHKIGYCLGCGTCITTSKCVQKDDMAVLLDKMVSADVIVLATPVYFYTMSAQMKTFIDRTVPRYLEISNKEFYYIVSAANTKVSSMEKTIESFREFVIKGGTLVAAIVGLDIRNFPSLQTPIAEFRLLLFDRL